MLEHKIYLTDRKASQEYFVRRDTRIPEAIRNIDVDTCCSQDAIKRTTQPFGCVVL